jgi:hypothetical protein
MSVQRVSRTSRPPRPGIDWLNKVGQAVNDHEQRSKTFGPRAARPVSKDPEALIVLVKNTTEETIGQYRPLDLDGTVIHEQDIVLKGVAGAGGRFAITQEPIPAGGVGRAAISGMTKAWVTGATATQASSGDGVVEMGSGIAEVIYDSDDAVTTERIAILLFDKGETAIAWGVVIGEVDSGGPGAPKIRVGDEIGMAKVQIVMSTDARYYNEEVWVGDYLGQILANEPAADRIGRQVIMANLGRTPTGGSTFFVENTATSSSRYTRWNLITANCPE